MPRAALRALLALAAAWALVGCTVWQAGDIAPTYANKRVHRGAEALAFDVTSTTLASGGWNGEIALWALDGDRPERVWQAHEGFVQGLDWTDDGIVSAGDDGRLGIWRRDGTQVASTDTGNAITRMHVLGGLVVTAHMDGSVRTWHLPDLAPVRRFDLHHGEVAALAVEPGSGRIASGGYDGQAFVIDPDGTARALTSPSAAVRSLAFGPGGHLLFAGGWFRLYRWDLATGEMVAMDTPHWGVVTDLAMLPDGHTLASISRVNDSSVLFLDTATGAAVRRFRPQSACGGAVSVSRDGHYLAATGDDGAVRIWDLEAAPGGGAPPRKVLLGAGPNLS